MLERGSQSITLEQLGSVLRGAMHGSVDGVHENKGRDFGVIERELCASGRQLGSRAVDSLSQQGVHEAPPLEQIHGREQLPMQTGSGQVGVHEGEQDVIQARSAVDGIAAQLAVRFFRQAQREQLGWSRFVDVLRIFAWPAGTPLSAASIAQGTQRGLVASEVTRNRRVLLRFQ